MSLNLAFLKIGLNIYIYEYDVNSYIDMSQPILINILPKFYNSYNYYYSIFTFYA